MKRLGLLNDAFQSASRVHSGLAIPEKGVPAEHLIPPAVEQVSLSIVALSQLIQMELDELPFQKPVSDGVMGLAQEVYAERQRSNSEVDARALVQRVLSSAKVDLATGDMLQPKLMECVKLGIDAPHMNQGILLVILYLDPTKESLEGLSEDQAEKLVFQTGLVTIEIGKVKNVPLLFRRVDGIVHVALKSEDLIS